MKALKQLKLSAVFVSALSIVTPLNDVQASPARALANIVECEILDLCERQERAEEQRSLEIERDKAARQANRSGVVDRSSSTTEEDKALIAEQKAVERQAKIDEQAEIDWINQKRQEASELYTKIKSERAAKALLENNEPAQP